MSSSSLEETQPETNNDSELMRGCQGDAASGKTDYAS